MGIPSNALSTLGVGIYSFADAARFIGTESRELRRWMKGYSIKRDGESISYDPLWRSQHSGTEFDAIGFRDLIELRFVRFFVSAGIPLLVIRRTIQELREQLDKEYPFTSTSFRTDGRRIFMEVLCEGGDQSLVDIVKRQNVMPKVIGPSLREGIVLNVDEEAMRWYPLKNKSIVFDPARSFGQPILTDAGVPTAAVVETLQAEGGDIKRVARLFEVTPAQVRSAVAYEAQVRH